MPEETKETTTETTESTLDTEKTAEVATEETKTEETHTEDQAKEEKKAEEATDEKKTEEKSEDRELTIESYGDLGLVEEGDVNISQELQKSFKEVALKHKISIEAAKEIAAVQYSFVKKERDAYTAMQKSWEKEISDTYGDNLKNVQTNCGRVLAEYDKSGKFQEFLKIAGAENHPATLEFLKSVGDVLLEKPSINPSATAPVKEATLEDFYNN
jgi:hypothetical protein